MMSNNRKRTWDRSDGKTKQSKKNRLVVAPRKETRYDIYSKAGTQLLRDFNHLRKFVNTEVHYVDTTASTTATTTTVPILLNGISVGDTTTTRTGQSVKMSRCDVRVQLAVNATSLVNFTRIIFVIDKQANATTITGADLLVSSTTYSPYTFGSQGRFVTLYDETIALSTYSNGAVTLCFGLPSMNQHVIFNTSNTGTIADIVTNAIYLLYLSDQVANPPSITYHSRFWFVDN